MESAESETFANRRIWNAYKEEKMEKRKSQDSHLFGKIPPRSQ